MTKKQTMKDIWAEYALGLNSDLNTYVNSLPKENQETAMNLLHDVWVLGFLQARGMIVKVMHESKMVAAAKHFHDMGDDEPNILNS